MTVDEGQRLSALETELAALRERVTALEQQRSGEPSGLTSPNPERFWALNQLQAQTPAGAVLFAGHAPLPDGSEWAWQEAYAVPDLLARDWQAPAEALAALGHPLRLRLLRAVLDAPQTAAELGERVGLSGGGLYHHLRQLQAAGWLEAQARGPFRVPAGKVVALLVVLAACGLGEAETLPPQDN